MHTQSSGLLEIGDDVFAFSMQFVFGWFGGQYAAYPHSVHGLVVFPSWRAATVSAVMFPEYPAEQKQSSGLLAPGGASALSGHEEIWSPPGQNEPSGHGSHGPPFSPTQFMLHTQAVMAALPVWVCVFAFALHGWIAVPS